MANETVNGIYEMSKNTEAFKKLISKFFSISFIYLFRSDHLAEIRIHSWICRIVIGKEIRIHVTKKTAEFIQFFLFLIIYRIERMK